VTKKEEKMEGRRSCLTSPFWSLSLEFPVMGSKPPPSSVSREHLHLHPKSLGTHFYHFLFLIHPQRAPWSKLYSFYQQSPFIATLDSNSFSAAPWALDLMIHSAPCKEQNNQMKRISGDHGTRSGSSAPRHTSYISIDATQSRTKIKSLPKSEHTNHWYQNCRLLKWWISALKTIIMLGWKEDKSQWYASNEG
jgi:hypothetical protein